jgi:thiamine biosynthesis protein ThiI
MAISGEKCLLVKTSSEIALKSSRVRRYFNKKLLANIRLALKRNSVPCARILRGGGRLYLFSSQPKKAAAVLQRVVGVHAVAFAVRHSYACYDGVEGAVLKEALSILKKGDSFALRVRRAVESGISSKEYENRLGRAVMEAIPGLRVNLSKPKVEIFVEVRKRDLFVYSREVPCLRGLPLGVEGNTAFLFDGKRAELLAAFLLMFRGCNVFPVVQKRSDRIEAFVNRLVPYNSYRRFAFAERKDLPRLIADKKIHAIGTADAVVTKKSLLSFRKFDSEQGVIVMRPLLLYPRSMVKEKEKLFSA